MPRATLIVGCLLVLLGLLGYFGLGRQSLTALIPAGFGLPLTVLGLIARRPGRLRRPAMHGASLLALLGLAGAARGVPATIRLLAGQDTPRPAAAVAQALMAALCLALLLLALKAFIDARRAQRRASPGGP